MTAADIARREALEILGDATDRHWPIRLLAAADRVEEAGMDEASAALRSLDGTIREILAGRDALRAALVEPQCLRINVDGEWHWSLFRALPDHPSAGNAGQGYAHPTDLGSHALSRGKSDTLRALTRPRADLDQLSYLYECLALLLTLDHFDLITHTHNGVIYLLRVDLLTDFAHRRAT